MVLIITNNICITYSAVSSIINISNILLFTEIILISINEYIKLYIVSNAYCSTMAIFLVL